MDYKYSLNLPGNAFPMKANLPQREPGILDFWERTNNYENSIADDSRPPFILHDGPPYANGDIHMGHTLNKVLKDITVRYKSMRGYWAPYVPGWDCHGQPIDHQVEKKLKGKDIPTAAFRTMCRDYALDYVKRQTVEFKRLGVRGNFDDPYLTLNHEYEATIARVFSDMYKKGLIYEGLKPVYWCYHDRTALAEAEIEYEDESSPSIYVKFPLKSDFEPLRDFDGPKSIVIWTTTPWTLPANVAIAVHPDEEYTAIITGGEVMIVAASLAGAVISEAGLEDAVTGGLFKGIELKGLLAGHPILDKNSVVVMADYVTLDTGTGCVHIAPGHGVEDYQVGIENNLPIVMPVDDGGVFTDEAGKWVGQHVKKANPAIVEDLRERGILLASNTVMHSYPHCWRCKNPVIFRATRQWFVSMDKGDMRRKALEAIKTVDWIPKAGEKRITAMVVERPDWCISRQRKWGVPLPIFYCDSCGESVVNESTLSAVEDMFRKEGADAWYTKEAVEIAPAGTVCGKCGGDSLRKGMDILDVWFESGTSHEAVLRTRPDQRWPADLYLEGSDQHRGWFQLSLLVGVGVGDSAPFKSVLTHGFTVDGQGRKMSKSLGNVISPLDLMSTNGADILRLWVSSGDYSSPAVAISEEIISQVGESYRRIRNTVRFLLGNLVDFDTAADTIASEEMEEIDRWAMMQADRLLAAVTDAFDRYQFHEAYREIYGFCSTAMSSFYLDVMKDRLYTYLPDSRERRSAQTAMSGILSIMTRIIAPVLAFTAEEIWQTIPESMKDTESVHLTSWPAADDRFENPALDDKWVSLIQVRDDVLKVLEVARNEKKIGNSLEAKVELYTDGMLRELLVDNEKTLPMLFIVSQAIVVAEEAPNDAVDAQTIKGLKIRVVSAEGEKCQRCWNYNAGVGSDSEHPELCPRCAVTVRNWPANPV